MLSIIVLLASLAFTPTAVIAQSTVKCAGNPSPNGGINEASSTGTFQFPCGESTTLKSNANTIAPGTCSTMECVAQMCCEACINCPAPAPVVPAICEHKSSFNSSGMYTIQGNNYPCSGLVGMSIVKGGFPWFTAQCADFLNPELSYLTLDFMPGFNGCCNDYRNTCINSAPAPAPADRCGADAATKALTTACSCGTSGVVCGVGKYCWMGMICRDTPYPCGDTEQFCGRYNLKGKSYEEQDKMYKEDFKGGCLDMTTCPDDVKDDERTECERFIAESNEPGKCYAVCTIGFSKVGHDSLKDQNKCTDDEKKQYDEVTEKNEAAYKASLSSGSAVAPTLAAVTTAAIVVFAALY
jgi:hypothetical protein